MLNRSRIKLYWRQTSPESECKSTKWFNIKNEWEIEKTDWVYKYITSSTLSFTLAWIPWTFFSFSLVKVHVHVCVIYRALDNYNYWCHYICNFCMILKELWSRSQIQAIRNEHKLKYFHFNCFNFQNSRSTTFLRLS
jgi:hypothetical protein